MEKKITEEIKDFFYGLQTAQKLIGNENTLINISTFPNKVISIRVLKKNDKMSYKVFLDMSIKNNKATMTFHFTEDEKIIMDAFSYLMKKNYAYSILKNNFKISITYPSLSNVIDLYFLFENFFKSKF
jgi:hypothetical protein